MRNAITGRRGRKRTIIVAAAAVLVVAAGVAYAAWTASGGGSGYAKASTAQALATHRRLRVDPGDPLPRGHR